MKFAEINRQFTQKVADLINKGYIINSSTMGGSQGEIAKVDLTDGKSIIRVRITEFYFQNAKGTSFYLDGVSLIVSITHDVKCIHSSDRLSSTLWDNKMNVISQTDFYVIGENRNSKWYGTLEEAIVAKAKWSKRLENRTAEVTNKFGIEARDIVLPFIKRQPKCKSVKLADIDSVVKTIDYRFDNKGKVSYNVTVKGKKYFLH